jgi:DHA2 family multidrug resistance protein
MATSFSLFLYGWLDPRSSAAVVIGPQLIRGIGLALMMGPLMKVAINAVPKEQVATASSFLNVAQRVGGSFGIALLNTYLTKAIHVHAVRLGEQLGPNTPAFARLAGHASSLVFRDIHGLVPSGAIKGLAVAAQAVQQEASVLGFDNAFVLAALILLAGAPPALFLRSAIRDLGSTRPEVSPK